jgi:DNA-binding NarL/FixJ family response regulator
VRLFRWRRQGRGETPLSNREQGILQHFVTEQRSVAEIASELWISQQTVEFHLRNIISKLLAR